MENLDLRKAVYEYLRDNLSVNVSAEREYDYDSEYSVIRVGISLRDPSTGKYVEIEYESDCIY